MSASHEPAYAGDADRAAPRGWKNLSSAQMAEYIEDMTRELLRLASGPELDALRAHLGFACDEAHRIATGDRKP